jgi:MSHA biogenesis protein MshI
MPKTLVARLLPRLRSARAGVTVGLELQPNSLALVAQQQVNGQAQVRHLDVLALTPADNPAQLLKSWVAEHKLTKAGCRVVLGADTYQILLVEPPDVPWEELRHAIRWRLKDLISIPVDQAALEVFALPADGLRSNKKMVYVVACESKKIRFVIDMVREAGLELISIDIGELSLRNLALRLLPPEQAERSIAVVRIRQGAGSIYIYRQGNLYLGRTFSLNYNGGLMDTLPEEALALELQRSLDYYERQMGQAPPAAIYVCGENISQDKIGTVLKASLAPQVKWLDPAEIAHFSAEESDDALVQQCIAALGGALRVDEAA